MRTTEKETGKAESRQAGRQAGRQADTERQREEGGEKRKGQDKHDENTSTWTTFPAKPAARSCSCAGVRGNLDAARRDLCSVCGTRSAVPVKLSQLRCPAPPHLGPSPEGEAPSRHGAPAPASPWFPPSAPRRIRRESFSAVTLLFEAHH
eukprot:755727-Hanusia_phi.AAC.3